MYKQTLAILLASATLAACGSRPENPVDYVTYRDEPLVKQVENGMTMQKVIAIGGSPSSVIDLPHGAPATTTSSTTMASSSPITCASMPPAMWMPKASRPASNARRTATPCMARKPVFRPDPDPCWR